MLYCVSTTILNVNCYNLDFLFRFPLNLDIYSSSQRCLHHLPFAVGFKPQIKLTTGIIIMLVAEICTSETVRGPWSLALNAQEPPHLPLHSLGTQDVGKVEPCLLQDEQGLPRMRAPGWDGTERAMGADGQSCGDGIHKDCNWGVGGNREVLLRRGLHAGQKQNTWLSRSSSAMEALTEGLAWRKHSPLCVWPHLEKNIAWGIPDANKHPCYLGAQPGATAGPESHVTLLLSQTQHLFSLQLCVWMCCPVSLEPSSSHLARRKRLTLPYPKRFLDFGTSVSYLMKYLEDGTQI